MGCAELAAHRCEVLILVETGQFDTGRFGSLAILTVGDQFVLCAE